MLCHTGRTNLCLQFELEVDLDAPRSCGPGSHLLWLQLTPPKAAHIHNIHIEDHLKMKHNHSLVLILLIVPNPVCQHLESYEFPVST